jgi:hypothetical protein
VQFDWARRNSLVLRNVGQSEVMKGLVTDLISRVIRFRLAAEPQWPETVEPYRFLRLCARFLERRGWALAYPHSAQCLAGQGDFAARLADRCIFISCRPHGFLLTDSLLAEERFRLLRNREFGQSLIVTANPITHRDQLRLDGYGLVAIHYQSLGAFIANRGSPDALNQEPTS